jgi:hypothetical protein
MADLTLPRVTPEKLHVGHVARGVFDTVVPGVSLGAFDPRNIVSNWASSNPIARTIQNIGYNINYQRTKHIGAFHNPVGMPKAQAGGGMGSGGGTGYVGPGGFAAGPGGGAGMGMGQTNQLLSAILSTVQSIAATMGATNGSVKDVAASVRSETKTLSSGLQALFATVSDFTKQFLINQNEKKYDDAEHASGGKRGGIAGAVASDKLSTNSMIATIGATIGLLSTSLGRHITEVVAVVNRLFKTQFTKVLKIADEAIVGPITASFRAIFKPVVETFAKITKALGPFAEFFKGAPKMLGEFLGIFKALKFIGMFAKMIPVIGEFVIVITSIVDAFVGFKDAFAGSKGSLIDKLMAGVVGALKGVVKGLVEPFTMLADFIRSGIANVIKALGFGQLANNIGKFNITDFVKNMIDKIAIPPDAPKQIFDIIVGMVKRFLGIGPTVASAAGSAVKTVYHAAAHAAAAATHRGMASVASVTDLTLGAVSKQFESNGNVATISSGKNDPGGKSYGSFQLSLTKGTLAAYIKASKYGKEFAGLALGSPAFDQKWREIAARDPKGFEADQHDFIQRTHYDRLNNNLAKTGIKLAGRGRAVNEMLWSSSVQYGQADELIEGAIAQKGARPEDLTNDQLIDMIQDRKILWAKRNHQENLVDRIQRERKTLHALEAQKVHSLAVPATAVQANAIAAQNKKQLQISMTTVNAPTVVAPTTNNTVNNHAASDPGPMRPLDRQDSRH